MMAYGLVAAVSSPDDGGTAFARAIVSPEYIALTVASICIVSVLMALLFFKVTGWQDKEYRRNPLRYPQEMVRSSLRKMRVRKVKKFLHDHPEHFRAYLRVRDTVVLENRHKVDIALALEAHDLGMLVYPGDAELEREEILISLIKDRGVYSSAYAAALLDEIQSHPTPLTGGAL